MAATPSPKPTSTIKASDTPAPAEAEEPTVKAPEDATEEDLEKDPNADLQMYVVTADAITYRTGPGKTEIRRFNRGARLRLHATEERVKDFVRSKSIAVHEKNKQHPRTTAMHMFRLWGAEDDPATPPMQEVQPFVQPRVDAGATDSDEE